LTTQFPEAIRSIQVGKSFEKREIPGFMISLY